MHFSDIHRAVAAALAVALLPLATYAQADPDQDEPPPTVERAEPAPDPAPPPPAATPAIPDGTGAVEVMPPAEKAPEAPADAKLTWTALGGQQRAGDGVVSVAFGFSGLPVASYHYAVSDEVSLGVAGGFDFARYVPEAAFDAGGHAAASVKVGVPIDENLRLAIRGDLGILVASSPGVGLTLDVSANLLAPLADGFFAGAGIDVPLTVRIYDGGTALGWPILFGGVAEYRVLAPLSLIAEAKIGPAFAPGGVYFAMRLLGGVAYRL